MTRESRIRAATVRMIMVAGQEALRQAREEGLEVDESDVKFKQEERDGKSVIVAYIERGGE